MKPNIFQKIAFFLYFLTISVIIAFLVPYELSGNTFHNSLFSNYGSMIYFRFLIYITIPSIIFIFSYKSLEKCNEIEKETYKKKARIELYIFSFFIITELMFFLFFIINNNYSRIKKIEYENEYKFILSEKRKNHVVFFNEYVVNNKILSLKKLKEIKKGDLNTEYLDLKKVTREKLFHTENGLYVRESEYTNEYSDFFMKNFHEVYDNLIREKKIFEVKYEKQSPLMIDLERKVKRLVFYSKDEIQKNVICSFFILLIALYLIRPFLFSYKSMINEINK